MGGSIAWTDGGFTDGGRGGVGGGGGHRGVAARAGDADARARSGAWGKESGGGGDRCGSVEIGKRG